MDDAARARDTAREALADIGPERLAAVLDDRLAAASMAPGALTMVSARAADSTAAPDAAADRAAGVQLIYEGLGLTRRLADEEPWAGDDPAAAADADLEILAADVLVARGFYLLARTEAAGRAVETVRRFGRDQTRRRAPDADAVALDANLEASVFALAVEAGTTAVGATPPTRLVEHAAGLAREAEGLPAVGSLPDPGELADVIGEAGDDEGGGRVPSSATDP